MDNRDHESNLQSEINNLPFRHTPVLLSEVIAGLAPRSGGRYVDGTLGGGGHALAILAASSPKGRLLGIDADPSALAAASTRLAIYGERATLVHGNFRDLVNETPESELADLIYRYGEEHGSRRVARFIAEARRKRPIATTSELADLVARALGGRRGKIHPATRTFQALRIAVNRELESL